LIDRVTGQPITRLLTFDGDEAGGASGTRTQSRDIGRELARASGQMSDAEARKLQQLRDLIEQCLLIDPARRITPEDALKHPFIHDTV
jgi:serine/threonine-protein kinase PRP4